MYVHSLTDGKTSEFPGLDPQFIGLVPQFRPFTAPGQDPTVGDQGLEGAGPPAGIPPKEPA